MSDKKLQFHTKTIVFVSSLLSVLGALIVLGVAWGSSDTKIENNTESIKRIESQMNHKLGVIQEDIKQILKNTRRP